MQNATFIRDFLQACPWVIDDIPYLKTEYDHFARSIFQYMALQDTLQPYVKLYYQDSAKIFHNKTLETLTGLAVLYLKPYHANLSGYNAPLSPAAEKLFRDLCAKKGINLDGQSLTQNISVTV